MEIDLKLEGLGDLERRLRALPGEVAETAMINALDAPGKILQAAIQNTAPIRTGRLLVSIDYKKLGGERVDQGMVIVGPRYFGFKAKKSKKPRNPARTQRGPSSQDPGVYADFIERGTFNTPPRPFMRPAFAAGAEPATQGFISALDKELDKAVRKVGGTID